MNAPVQPVANQPAAPPLTFFDFRGRWKQVRRVLARKQVRAKLAAAMDRYANYHGIPQMAANEGPWALVRSRHWTLWIEARARKAGQKVKLGNPGDALNDFQIRVFERHCPKAERDVEFYQLWDAGDQLADWHIAIAQRLFRDAEIKVLRGQPIKRGEPGFPDQFPGDHWCPTAVIAWQGGQGTIVDVLSFETVPAVFLYAAANNGRSEAA